LKNKNLNDLSIHELGQLFPIEIVPYDKNWIKIYNSEKKRILYSLGSNIVKRLEHFGSTAVPGLASKPIIDILIEIPSLTDELKSNVIKTMKNLKYHFIWRTDESIPYMNFVKGYFPYGYKGEIIHVHMGDDTHPIWDRLYFRDYLRAHPETALEYEKLKYELAQQFKFNRKKYTGGKLDFVQYITKKAKIEISRLNVNIISK
jgi:GrpB-like predicted nucleotidyltransferase (UPF0157 family)